MPHLRKTRVSDRWVLILETICNIGFFLRSLSCVAIITGIPLSYVVGGSDTGNISRGDVSRDRFSYKRNVNVGPINAMLMWAGRLQTIHFDQEKRY